MRNFLLKNIIGADTYSHHAYEAFRTLKATGEGKTPFTITDVNKLKWMCEKLGVDASQDANQMAIDLTVLLENQQKVDLAEKNIMFEAFAPRKRKDLWKKLDIYPAGTVHEEQNCVASYLTNVDGNHVSLAMKALRLGIATIYNTQIGLEMVQYILFGIPNLHEVNMDLGIMDPNHVNLVFNGHQPCPGVATLFEFCTVAIFSSRVITDLPCHFLLLHLKYIIIPLIHSSNAKAIHIPGIPSPKTILKTYANPTPTVHIEQIPTYTGNLTSPQALRQFIITRLNVLPGSRNAFINNTAAPRASISSLLVNIPNISRAKIATIIPRIVDTINAFFSDEKHNLYASSRFPFPINLPIIIADP